MPLCLHDRYGEQIGDFQQKWKSLLKEMFTYIDNFSYFSARPTKKMANIFSEHTMHPYVIYGGDQSPIFRYILNTELSSSVVAE